MGRRKLSIRQLAKCAERWMEFCPRKRSTTDLAFLNFNAGALDALYGGIASADFTARDIQAVRLSPEGMARVANDSLGIAHTSRNLATRAASLKSRQ